MPTLHRLAACTGCGRQFDVSGAPELAELGPGDSFPCSCGTRVTVPTGQASDAAVVSCAACGAPREGRAASCTYCGSTFTLKELDLDAICPRCMARVSRRGRFCHHCSLPITAPREAATPTTHDCPACAAPAAAGRSDDGPAAALASRPIGAGGEHLHFFECSRCAGIWLDREIFTVLLGQAKSGRPLPVPGSDVAKPTAGLGGDSGSRAIAYRPCAVCSKLMNRQNYGRRSGVIIDLCKDHGVWFDHDELRRVLEWVRRGGFTAKEAAAAAAAEEARARRPAPPPDVFTSYGSSTEAKWQSWTLGDSLFRALAAMVDGAFERISDRWGR